MEKGLFNMILQINLKYHLTD
uniref:Uncharacterized protein n=1 Tax=Rhizophora mucronata TaxID=61149 RepID=A0A2P2Q2E7_RHIMU